MVGLFKILAVHKTLHKNGLSYCNELFICKSCGVFVSLRNMEGDNKHVCGEVFCKVCKVFVPQATHLCYLEPLKLEPVVEKPFHIYFDYETWNNRERGHVPVMVVVQYADGTEFRFPPYNEPIDELVGEKFAT